MGPTTLTRSGEESARLGPVGPVTRTALEAVREVGYGRAELSGFFTPPAAGPASLVEWGELWGWGVRRVQIGLVSSRLSFPELL